MRMRPFSAADSSFTFIVAFSLASAWAAPSRLTLRWYSVASRAAFCSSFFSSADSWSHSFWLASSTCGL
ncbi:hypothetical protein D3C85_1539010 [compost metagenome]